MSMTAGHRTLDPAHCQPAGSDFGAQTATSLEPTIPIGDPRPDEADHGPYLVVMNDEDLYQIWFADQDVPDGWRAEEPWAPDSDAWTISRGVLTYYAPMQPSGADGRAHNR